MRELKKKKKNVVSKKKLRFFLFYMIKSLFNFLINNIYFLFI